MIHGFGFKPAALKELDEAISWYERQEPGLGARLEAEIASAVRRIKTNSKEFPLVRPGVRKALIITFPYAIYFTEVTEQITIIRRFHHSARNPARLKPRLRRGA